MWWRRRVAVDAMSRVIEASGVGSRSDGEKVLEGVGTFIYPTCRLLPPAHWPARSTICATVRIKWGANECSQRADSAS